MNGETNLIGTFTTPPDDRAARIAALTEKAKKAFTALLKPGPMLVTITHEPFLPWFVLEFNGQTEELDHMECLAWFKDHGAKNEDRVNDAIMQAFNFYKAEYEITEPKDPPRKAEDIPGVTPKI